MKEETLIRLDEFEKALRRFKAALLKNKFERINKKEFIDEANRLASIWVEELRSPLEHRFKISSEVILSVSEQVKRLYRLARPNNLKKSYVETLEQILYKFKDRLVLPIQEFSEKIDTVNDLEKLLPSIKNHEESGYLKEAINCAEQGFFRASIVLGWCAAVSRIQTKIINFGFDKFNTTSRAVKAQTKGKNKNWKKEFSITSIAELQEIFDKDLIVIIEAMSLIDGNESLRLSTCFEYRNQCAHPSQAPIEIPHLIVFFTDILTIVINNPKFN